MSMTSWVLRQPKDGESLGYGADPPGFWKFMVVWTLVGSALVGAMVVGILLLQG